jgi:hypothetical protein
MLLIWLLSVTISSATVEDYSFTICNKKIDTKQKSIYLKDERLKAVMYQYYDRQTHRFLLGHIKNAVRNDTNFIESTRKIVNDTITITTLYRYNIKPSMDSVIRVFVCRKGILVAVRDQAFKAGQSIN